MSGLVLYERQGPAGVLRLNRPDKYNALSQALLAELSAHLAAADADPEVRAVIITGSSDKFFCTGADLNEGLAVQSAAQTVDWLRRIREVNHQIERLTKPVIAAINGYCMTGGFELALACDLRVAGENAVFGITSARIGTVAGAGGTQRLPRLIGPALAKEVLLLAENIDAATAYRMGILNRLVPVAETLPEALRMAAVLATRAPLSLRFTKQVVNVGLNLDLESALDLEVQISANTYASEDRREGIAAFLEKRKPVFRGR